MMPSAKIAMLASAPPENMLNMPSTPRLCCSKACAKAVGVDAGERNVGAETIDQQRTDVNQMRFLRSSALAKAAKFRLEASCSAADAIEKSPLRHAGGPQRAARLDEATR